MSLPMVSSGNFKGGGGGGLKCKAQAQLLKTCSRLNSQIVKFCH